MRHGIRSIGGRWLLNGMAIILVAVLLSVAFFSIMMSSYFYSAMKSSLQAKAQTASEFFTSYVTKTYADYYQSAYRYTEEFDDKDVIELQFVNTRGRVEVSSYGITAGTSPRTPDIADALNSREISVWSGESSTTGERVMAVSAPLLYSDGSVVGIMRYVTSMRLVDRAVWRMTAMAAGVGALVIAVVLITNILFVRTITEPILGLTDVARRIADGSYGIQAAKKRDDEIGELTDAINEMSAKIGQSERMQTEFISSVSHELRTPLTAITGWSETLAYDEAIQGDSRRGVAIISREAARLTKMVEDLLEFTRIQDGRFNLNVRKMDIVSDLEESIFTYRELLRRESIELEYDPPEEEIPPVMGDSERLKQVFLNILDNAAKYGRRGGRITVTISREEDEAVISIRDYGPGIPEDELSHVKERFYKGSSKERGSGIGLSVCDEIISRHGGSLTIANAEGGGCCVKIALPLMDEADYNIQ